MSCFRGGSQNVFQPHKDASSAVIVDSTMLFDLQTLTGHAKAFINADRDALLRGAVKLLPANRVVIEILETVEPSADLIAACADLRHSGYLLALDDFIDQPKWQPLLELADFLKVDFRLSDPDACREIARRYLPRGLQLIAEKSKPRRRLTRPAKWATAIFRDIFSASPPWSKAAASPATN